MPSFDLVVALFSFVYALALTHLLQSVSDLWVERHRVKFSLVLAVWMVISGLLLVLNWLALAPLTETDWTMQVILASLLTAVTQYFTCSLVSIRVPQKGVVDMRAYVERQGNGVRVAYLLLIAWALTLNVVHWSDLDLGPFSLMAFVTLCATEIVFGVTLMIGFWRREPWVSWAPAMLYAVYLSGIMLGFFY